MERKSRKTKQKELIEKEMKKLNSFFTADELLTKVSKTDDKIGIATIYRFLGDSARSRKIHAYLCGRKRIYSVDEKSHCHFICEKCGQVSHIKIDSIDFIKNKIRGAICHFQIDVNGICERCSRKN